MSAAPAQSTPESPPDDADDLRGFHFKRLLGKPLTWALIGIEVLLVGVLLAVYVGPAIGGAAAVLAFLLGLLAVFAIADSRAEQGFFETYAAENGLELGGRSALPETTPLLRKGDDRYAERSLSGRLDEGVGGIEGILALYTYEEESTDADGDRQTNYYHYTVCLIPVPECVPHVPELYCRRKSGLRSLEKLEDVFRSTERVKFESEALEERYEIFTGKEQDQVWLRRLFSPTFIVWLGEEAPKKFAFELVDGTLCCFVNGHKKSAAELDTMRAASTAVARRLLEESAETSGASPEPTGTN
ncbi:MAG TPA: hypothetical protein VG816_07620 [Solirubrobacterales bacterium]|nr:hypothetical protein [Solirubrobacterales bacterium]